MYNNGFFFVQMLLHNIIMAAKVLIASLIALKDLKDLMKHLTEKRLLSSHEYKLFSMVFPNSCLKIKYAVLD